MIYLQCIRNFNDTKNKKRTDISITDMKTTYINRLDLNRMKKVLGLSLLFIFGGLLFNGRASEAATTKNISLWDKNSTVLKADITRDGKKDKIAFTQKMDKDNQYVDKFIVKVNGKKALTIKNSGGLFFGVEYMKLTKKREFLHIYAVAENDYQSLSRIYSYNKKTKKFENKGNLFKGIPCRWAYIDSVKKNRITVKYNDQKMEVGTFEWFYDYSVSNSSISLSSKTTSTVKSLLGDMNWSEDDYCKYFKKNQFKVANSFKLYTDTSCQTEAFAAEKDSVLTMKKLSIKSKKTYIMFELDGKTGWLPIGSSDVYDFSQDDPSVTGPFYGVYQRLAG